MKALITFKTSSLTIAVDGRIDADIESGALRQAVDAKRKVYLSCVISVLLYGGEC